MIPRLRGIARSAEMLISSGKAIDVFNHFDIAI